MRFIKSIISKIKAAVASLSQPALPASTVSAPHIRALLLHLCNQDVEQATWLARWLAFPLRNPGAKMATAILVAGVQGAEKSLLFERVIGPMYGSQAQLDSVQLSSKFNSWLIGKRYAVLSDISNNDLQSSKLKNLVSGSSITVHRYQQEDIVISNSLNIVLMTTDDVEPDPGSRRLVTLDPQQPLPVELAAAVVHEIENGGLVEFHRYLTHDLDMGVFDQYTPAPRTAESAVAA